MRKKVILFNNSLDPIFIGVVKSGNIRRKFRDTSITLSSQLSDTLGCLLEINVNRRES